MKKAKGARADTVAEAICRAPLAQPSADEVVPPCGPVAPWLEAFECEHYGMAGEEAMEQSIYIECKKLLDITELSKQYAREYQAIALCSTCFIDFIIGLADER